jgi:Acetyltransferase (GNAT) family
MNTITIKQWHIRKAVSTDAQRICEMLFMLKTLYASTPANSLQEFLPIHLPVVQQALELPQNMVLVASKPDAELIGFISLTIRTVLRVPSPLGSIEEIFVCLEYRKCGVGTALWKEAAIVLRQKGVNRVEVISSLAASRATAICKKHWHGMVFISTGFDTMTTPTQQLFDGILLGDVVESMTGQDVNIKRSPSYCAEIVGSHLTRCSHRTRAYAGRTLLGTAEIVWEGAATYYAALLKSRMKDYLKSQQAQPVIESYDPDKGILAEFTKGSNLLVDSLFDEIRKSAAKVKYHDDGLKRWLFAIDKLAKEAKHEGHPIKYNVGYGSLAYAQAHLHRYEAVPDDFVKHDIPIENITSYIKGFYSIFGNHKSRGLWFDETGQYRGVFESSDDDFDKASSGRTTRSQHQDTILFAKIDDSGCFDIIQRDGNQIARVKNGEHTNMAEGDNKRRKAMRRLAESKKIPSEFAVVTKWLVNELVEELQPKTHGTSFVISFEEQELQKPPPLWRSDIEFQVKTLVRHFSQLDAPLADWDQLTEYATNWDISLNQKHNGTRQNYTRPSHLFDSLAELANLDGGLWLRLKLNKDKKGGLWVRAAQQFIPLIPMDDKKRPLDLQMEIKNTDLTENDLPKEATDNITNLEALFAAINRKFDVTDPTKKEYITALSFLQHSGTKTHSLWGLSLTAAEPCLCVVLSTDGNVYVFHDGREFTKLF